MKKAVAISTVVLVVVGAVLGLYFGLSSAGYTKDDIDKALDDGYTAGQGYKTTLEKKLADLETEIKTGNNALGNAEIEYTKLMADIEAEILARDKTMSEIAASNLGTLTGMKTTLSNLRDEYVLNVSDLETELDEITGIIADLDNGNGNELELTGFRYVRDYLTADIQKKKSIVADLNTKIAEIDAQITELTAE